MGQYFKKVLSIIESETGMSMASIREISPSAFLDKLEKERGKRLSYTSMHPVIGRGSVLRDFYTTEELDSEIDKILNSQK